MHRFVASLVSLIAVCVAHAGQKRPQLQIINGSTETVDVYWLKSGTERVPNGTLAPGKSTMIGTTIGHRFVVVGREDKVEAKITSQVRVQGFRFDPQGKNGVPSFYTQSESANGFPVVASAKVNPYALKEAAYLVNQMLANRADVREALIESGSRLCVIGWNEFTTDLPEFAHLEPVKGYETLTAKEYWDARARGTGGSDDDPFCSCAEENMLAYPGDPYELENILIHEFAHCIHLRGMSNVDPTFDDRLSAAYESAMKAGLWKGTYAATNRMEYFAEGVQSWFDNNRSNDSQHNDISTRAKLLNYDKGLAAMCREVFGDTVIKYTKPQTRLTGHLEGYDPSKAPRFVWPERLMKARGLIKETQLATHLAATGQVERDKRILAGWTVNVSTKLIEEDAAAVEKAMQLLRAQLDDIVRVVPKSAVVELQKVPLWISPEYPNTRPRAEYHPGADWLHDNHRDPIMAKGVEFTNVRIFEAETSRMPNFALHELAHSYHDRVLGFDHPNIAAAYQRAKESKSYDRVERWHGNGKPNTFERAYAMTNAHEYFAECTEAFFGRNDFFPFTREELQKHDPQMFAVLERVWNRPAP